MQDSLIALHVFCMLAFSQSNVSKSSFVRAAQFCFYCHVISEECFYLPFEIVQSKLAFVIEHLPPICVLCLHGLC